MDGIDKYALVYCCLWHLHIMLRYFDDDFSKVYYSYVAKIIYVFIITFGPFLHI